MNLTRHEAGATRYKSKEEAKLAKKRAQRVFIDRIEADQLHTADGTFWIVCAYMDGMIRFLVEAA